MFAVIIVTLLNVSAGFGRDRGTDTVMSPRYWEQWNAEVQTKIDKEIDLNRKIDVEIRFSSIKKNSDVQIEQIAHSFLFGGNLFLFGDLGSDERNKKYEDVFGSLFNAATIPFYWKTLEPERGKPRYTEGSSYIYRRPAPDPVVAFCKSKNINMNGHAIIYGLRLHGHPEWMPENRREMEEIFQNHIKDIAQRYGDRVQRWDVVNECINQANRGMMPDDYTYKAYKWAMQYFPAATQLNTNECDLHWGPTRRYVEIVRDLSDRNIRIDNVGVQMHIFESEESRQIAAGDDKFLTPAQNYAVLNCLKETERPIHISEVTICAPDSTVRGSQIQAIIARNLYRLWFSYPDVMGITWWNVVDGGAAKGEPSFSGIFRKDMTLKPVYNVLDSLINHEWKTKLQIAPDKDGNVTFRGFKGKYKITWKDRRNQKQVCFLDLNENKTIKMTK